MAYVSEQVC